MSPTRTDLCGWGRMNESYVANPYMSVCVLPKGHDGNHVLERARCSYTVAIPDITAPGESPFYECGMLDGHKCDHFYGSRCDEPNESSDRFCCLEANHASVHDFTPLPGTTTAPDTITGRAQAGTVRERLGITRPDVDIIDVRLESATQRAALITLTATVTTTLTVDEANRLAALNAPIV